MSEQIKYTINTIAATPRAGLDINAESPMTLIDNAGENNNILGVLPSEVSEEPNWVCILPLQQPQDYREGGAFAGMNTILSDKWCTLDKLNYDLLAPNMRFALKHLEEPGTAVGFNYSLDPRMRNVDRVERTKVKPNSWDHFHMHWMTNIHEVAQELKSGDTVMLRGNNWSKRIRPHRYLREIMPMVIENILDQEYRRIGFDKLLISTVQKDSLTYIPEGGIMFRLEHAFGDPQALGSTVMAIHNAFVDIHRKVWSIFVVNYDQVAASGWSAGYEPRPADESMRLLEEFTSSQELQKGILRFFGILRPVHEVPDSMHWLYMGPSYSMAFYKQDSDYILSMLPHLMHPTNWLGALGIFEVRQSQAVMLERHRSAANAYVRRLGAATLAASIGQP